LSAPTYYLLLMINNIQWRTSFLATTAIGIGMVALYVLIEPTAGNRPVANFDFPRRIPLNTWQQLDNKILKTSTPSSEHHNSERLESAHSYQYTKDDTKIAITARYLVGSRGNIDGYISQYTEVPSQALKPAKIEYLEGIGYYRLFTFENRAYLSSCISPRSQSSVTQKQFASSRYQADLKPKVIFNWLLGKASIRDSRCLWTHLSTPIPKSDPQIAYQTLETAWIDWYHWWLPRFPSL
jgi:cyanosortase A-associated protein